MTRREQKQLEQQHVNFKTMEKRTYYADRKTAELAEYLVKHRIPFYYDGRIIEFESTPERVRVMQESSKELS